MRFKSLAMGCMIGIVAFWFLGSSNQRAQSSEDRKAATTSWQHLALSHDTGLNDQQLSRQINRLGAEGWELVDVEVLPIGEGTKTVFYFKKPL